MVVQGSIKSIKGRNWMGRFWGKLYCFMRKYAYVPRNSNKIARNKTYGNLHMGLLRPRPHVFGYFGKRTFFLRFPKKKYVSYWQVAYWNRFRLSLRNRQSMEIQWHPLRSMCSASSKWCMVSLYSKTSVFVRLHVNGEASVFRKFHSGEPFRKDAFPVTVSAEYVSTVGQTAEKKSPFSNKNWYLWMGLWWIS